MDKNKQIKMIWQELQGYLSQTPLQKETNDIVRFDPLGNQINSTIDELNSITEKNYDKFKILLTSGDTHVGLVAIRIKLGGLIDKLHAEYFNSEPRPFCGSPQTVISQSQTQNQFIDINLLLDLNSKITSQLDNSDIKNEEKSFLEKIKSSLGSVKNTMELLSLILNTGSSFGITVETTKKLLGF